MKRKGKKCITIEHGRRVRWYKAANGDRHFAIKARGVNQLGVKVWQGNKVRRFMVLASGKIVVRVPQHIDVWVKVSPGMSDFNYVDSYYHQYLTVLTSNFVQVKAHSLTCYCKSVTRETSGKAGNAAKKVLP